MASRLAFQTQLASIMEVLANAAVAEICKLVDDDYAVVSLQMSQCQRENKALKRKLHLMELKMARGFAERRLRESAGGGGRARVHVGVSSDRFRSSSSSGKIETESHSRCETRSEVALPVKRNKPVSLKAIAQWKQSCADRCVGLQVNWREHLVEAGSSGAAILSRRSRQPTTTMSVRTPPCQPAPEDWRSVAPLLSLTPSSGPSHTAPTPRSTPPPPLDPLHAFSHTPADPQAKPSEELCTTISVHGGAPDTITPAKDSTSNQPRQDGSDTLASECSVLDLEAFFTRWTPDSGAPPAAPPSCSFSTEELLEEEEEEEVVLVEEGHQPPRRRAGAASSQRSSRIHTNHSPSPGTSLSASPRIQAPPPQLTWSRAAAMMRNAQTQSLQHGRHGNRTAHRVLHSAQNSLTTTANANAGARMRRLANFHSFPPAGLPARGSDGKGLGSDSSGLGGVSARLGGGTRRRNYACRACGKAFSGLSNLEAHQRVHTGEKPFSCSTCGKRFSEAGNLKKHQRVHTGDKPYGCQRCGKRFAWVCSLRTHQQSGTGCGLQGGGLGDLGHLDQ
ncbi:unnamed protein product [Merluccius merluccius]